MTPVQPLPQCRQDGTKYSWFSTSERKTPKHEAQGTVKSHCKARASSAGEWHLHCDRRTHPSSNSNFPDKFFLSSFATFHPQEHLKASMGTTAEPPPLPFCPHCPLPHGPSEAPWATLPRDPQWDLPHPNTPHSYFPQRSTSSKRPRVAAVPFQGPSELLSIHPHTVLPELASPRPHVRCGSLSQSSPQC